MSTDSLLAAQDVSRSFAIGERRITALSPVSLTVAGGDFLVVTGPSGSGKSTLLNLLSGFDRPSTGEVRFHGRVLARMSDKEAAGLRNHSFGFIYQTPHLLPDQTILENVALPFHYGAWIEPGLARRRCSELLDYVGIADLADRYPSTLSGGEMQRAVFARALTREPEIIFADEPTGSLDGRNSEKLLELLRSQTRAGRTVVMVTHDAEAIRYGTSQLVLAKTVSAGEI